MMTKKDSKSNAKLKAFEGTSWFKDKFGLLNKGNRKSDHIAPKALYNLNSGGVLQDHPQSSQAHGRRCQEG
jgi:hypothetical protein